MTPMKRRVSWLLGLSLAGVCLGAPSSARADTPTPSVVTAAKPFVGQWQCTVKAMGADPAPGKKKACRFHYTVATPAGTEVTENGSLAFINGYIEFFDPAGSASFKHPISGVAMLPCTVKALGAGDPSPGHIKTCRVLDVEVRTNPNGAEVVPENASLEMDVATHVTFFDPNVCPPFWASAKLLDHAATGTPTRWGYATPLVACHYDTLPAGMLREWKDEDPDAAIEGGRCMRWQDLSHYLWAPCSPPARAHRK